MSVNTITTVIEELTRAEVNNLEILTKLNNLVITDEKSVTIELINNDGSISSFEIPSIGYLVSEIERLKSNQNNIIGNTDAISATVQLSDGTYKRLFVQDVAKAPKSIQLTSVPTMFGTKDNLLTDLLLDPNLVINVDITDKVPISTHKVEVLKLVVTDTDIDNMNYFDVNFAGQVLSYTDVVNTLSNIGISYNERIFPIPINVSEPKYSGDFNVIDYARKSISEISNGSTRSVEKIVYKLNTLVYNDVDGNDYVLKPGSVLVLNNEDGTSNTEFVVERVFVNTNEIIIKNKFGYGSPRRGVSVFTISAASGNKKTIDVPVTANQRFVLFLKAVDDSLNLSSAEWGSGIGIFTNTLVNTNADTLLSYYNDAVKDMSSVIKIASEDDSIPVSEAQIPNSPVLIADNFRVERINSHKYDQVDIDSLRNQKSEQSKLLSEINALDRDIRASSEEIKIKPTNKKVEIASLRNNITKKTEQRKAKLNKYNSVTEVVATRSLEYTSLDFKYRVRGFWEMPDPVYKDSINKIGEQQVVQFKIRYRYLRTDNTATSSESYELLDKADNIITRASFSRWTEISGKARVRTISNGKLVWVDPDLSDPNEVNPNQLDIPISRNEHVQIQVKSISEVGYPKNPLESDWSDPIIVEFPDNFTDLNNLDASDASVQLANANLLNELSRINLDTHLSDSGNAGDNYYAHDAANIATTFRTPENLPRSVEQILSELNNKVANLEATISGTIPKVKVTILDELGDVIAEVNNNDTVNILAGYYVDDIAEATIKKGEIVSKMYFIEIENGAATDLSLLSYVPGTYTDVLPSDTSYDGYLTNKYEYDNYRKYYNAPLAIKANTDESIDYDNWTNDNLIAINPAFQSAQVKGQLVYLRNRDLSLGTKLYETPPPADDQVLLPLVGNVGDEKSYVWDFTRTPAGGNPAGNGKISNFCVHTNHPDLADGTYFMTNFNDLFSGNYLPNKHLNTTTGDVHYPLFYHSKYFNLQPQEADGNKQLGYVGFSKGEEGSLTASNFPRKIGFTANDKYLIGKNTVGSYLFMLPRDHKFLYTGSNVYNEGRVLDAVDGDKIRIPFMFQYRMTDYNGDGDIGIGTIGGYGAGRLTNLTYSKKLGIDIISNGNPSLFSFDIKVTAKYKPSNTADVKTLVR
jgi:hypothetical protein